MDRWKNALDAAVSLAKIISAVGVIIGLIVYVGTRASATEVAVLKAEKASDHEILMFVAKTVAGLAEQNNHQALTGHIPYVPPPPPPLEVLGPAQAPKSDAPR